MTDQTAVDNLISEVQEKIREADAVVSNGTSSRSVSAYFGSMSWMMMGIWIVVGIVVLAIGICFFTPAGKRVVNRINNLRDRRVLDKKEVKASELDADEERFEFFYQNWCGACKRFKPVLEDYTVNRSPASFRLIKHDCSVKTAAGEENADCVNYTTIPIFLYRKNASDIGTLYRGPATVDAIEEWVQSVRNADNNNNA
jgi:thiol:disulfide interchange protein